MKTHLERLQLSTRGEFDVVDITSDVEKAIVTSGIQDGMVVVYSPHTTCSVVINEKERGLLADLHGSLERLVPRDPGYQHDDFSIRTENMHPDETENAHAHLRQVLAAGVSESIPVAEGSLLLGHWQRVMVVEFDRARDREILIQVVGG